MALTCENKRELPWWEPALDSLEKSRYTRARSERVTDQVGSQCREPADRILGFWAIPSFRCSSRGQVN